MKNPIKEQREAKGIGRRELAQSAGVSYMTIANIEQGLPKTMNFLTAFKLSTKLEKPAETLYQEYAEWREHLED